MRHLTSTLTAAAVIMAAGTTADAATLVDFRFTNNSDPINENAGYSGGDTNSAANVSIEMGLTAGSGFRGLGNQADQFRAFDLIDETAPGSGIAENQTLAQAVAQDEFIGFTADAGDGFMLDLAGGTIGLSEIIFAGNADNSADQVTLFSSVDGFSVGSALDTESKPGSGNVDVTLDIPNEPRFDGLTEPVEFRFYFSRFDSNPAMATGGGIEFKAQNIGTAVTLNGEVTAIPEPASAAAGLAGLGLLLARRRRD